MLNFNTFLTQNPCNSLVCSAKKTYPFGMTIANRSISNNYYRYGFQGQEKDNEIYGEGNASFFKYRISDNRLGRFFAVDPLAKKYPHNSSYAFSENSTIAFVELEGLEKYYASDGTKLGVVGTSIEIRVVNSSVINQQAISLINNSRVPFLSAKQDQQLLLKNSVSLFDYADNVNDVLNDAPLETWAANGQNCYTAACAQMNNAGLSMENKYSAIQTDVDNSKQPSNQQLAEDAVSGTIYTMTQLKDGIPVMVGVKETSTNGSVVNVNNYNQNTGHFVVISSMQKTGNNVTFGYYDNANEATGKSLGNRFNVDTQTGAATDNTNIGVRGVQSYKVSEVRKNKL